MTTKSFGANCSFLAWFVLTAISLASAPFELSGQTFTLVQTVNVGNGPSSALITPDGTEVYVSNSGGNTVSVISTATDTVTATVGVGSGPDALAVSPDGSTVYVGQNGGNVSAIDTVTKAVTTINTLGGPVRDLAITPDGTKIYLAMESSGLREILTDTRTVITISTVTCPEGVAVTPDGRFLYVNYQCFGPGGSAGHDAIGKFDVSTDTFLTSITGLPNVGTKITISPDGSHAWASDSDACSSPGYDHAGCPIVPQGVVNVLDLVGPPGDSLLASIGVPGRVTVSPDNSFVVLGGSQLLILDPSTIAFVGLVNIAASGSLAVTADGTKAYAPVPGQNAVAVITVRM